MKSKFTIYIFIIVSDSIRRSQHVTLLGFGNALHEYHSIVVIQGVSLVNLHMKAIAGSNPARRPNVLVLGLFRTCFK